LPSPASTALSKTRTDRWERPRRLGLPRRPALPDHFRLAPKLDTGVLLLGRNTWELFSHIWPGQTDGFSLAMNRMPKLVATSTRTDLSTWQNSSPISGELLDVVEKIKAERDVTIAASASIVHALASTARWTNTASCTFLPRSAAARQSREVSL
jgi:dihydrofolate reductase